MSKVKSRTLSDFKSQYDPAVKVLGKIRAGLKELAAEGTESWELDKEFVARCGLNYATIQPYLDQFSDHIVMTKNSNKSSRPQRVWFADKKVAAKARGK